MKLNDLLTASRMNCFGRCPRQHFWACEVGLVKTQVSYALRFGSAWAKAMEARWSGDPYSIELGGELVGGALFYAQEDSNLDAYGCATIAALLAAYYEFYGPHEEEGRFLPEEEFCYDLAFGFRAAGKLDALGEMKRGGHAIIEGKTTGESIAPDAVYWLRLMFNVQLCQYVLAARKAGWKIEKVFYDVTRKPSIKPKMIDDLDELGRKIVLDALDARVFNPKKTLLNPKRKKGEKAEYKTEEDFESPRQTGDKAKGYAVKQHLETPDEYCDRLYRDALSRPTFYFARREVAILPAQLEQFEIQRNVVAQQINHLRTLERTRPHGNYEHWLENRDAEVWPRNVSKDTCNYCSFKGFCLQNLIPDINNLPEGYELRQLNPELTYDDNSSETADAPTE